MAITRGAHSSSRSDRSTRRSTRASASQSEAVAVPERVKSRPRSKQIARSEAAEIASSSRTRSRSRQIAHSEAAQIASSSRPRSSSRQIARGEAAERASTSRPRSRKRSRSAAQSEGGGEEEEEEEEDTEPMQPLKFYLDHTKLNTVCKFQTKCDVERTVKIIEETLDGDEKRWFTEHRQFRHMFHMFRHTNRKMMGMWALLLRAVETEKKEEMWFVLNGVPIRYSMREHALISGLDCGIYPPDYESVGNFAVVNRVFGRTEHIDMNDVKEKLVSMEKSDDRLRVAILYFLCTVIERKAKEGGKGYIGSFLLRVVDNLRVCGQFPWGRYTFLNNISNIKNLLTRFKEKGIRDSALPGFILPLEILAFECIPELKKTFRVAHTTGIDSSCPRMCKHRFKNTGTKGFSLGDIYDAIGTTKEIYSTLEPDVDEVRLVRRLSPEIDDVPDAIPDCWFRRLRRGHQIWWENLYQRDLESRKSPTGVAAAARVSTAAEGATEEAAESVARANEDEKLKALEKRFEKLERDYKKLQESNKQLQERLKTVEQIVSELKNGGNCDMEYDDYVFHASAPVQEDPAGTTNIEEPPENAESAEAPDQETPVEEEPVGTTNMEEPQETHEQTPVQEESAENIFTPLLLEYYEDQEEESAENIFTPLLLEYYEDQEEEHAETEPILLLSYNKEWEEENEIDHTPLAKRVKRPSQRCRSPYKLRW